MLHTWSLFTFELQSLKWSQTFTAEGHWSTGNMLLRSNALALPSHMLGGGREGSQMFSPYQKTFSLQHEDLCIIPGRARAKAEHPRHGPQCLRVDLVCILPSSVYQ